MALFFYTQTLFVATNRFSKDSSDKEEVIETLSEAMVRQNLCMARYHAFSEDRVNQFKIEPLHFFEHAGGLYVYVRTPKHGDVIALAGERIMELTVTDQEFEYPKDFDPQLCLAQAFGVASGPQAMRILSPARTRSPAATWISIFGRQGTTRSTCEPMRIIPKTSPRSTDPPMGMKTSIPLTLLAAI